MSQSSFLELKLEQERLRLQNIVQLVPGIVWEFFGVPNEGKAVIRYISGYVEEMLGFEVAEYSAANFFLKNVCPEDKDRTIQAFIKAYEQKEITTVQFRLTRKSGEYVWTETRIIPIKDEENKIQGLRGVTTDISNQKLLEREREELLRSQQKLKKLHDRTVHILESITDAFFTLDKEGSFTYINRFFAQLVGRGNELLLEKNIWEVFPEWRETQFYAKYLEAASTDQAVEFEEYYPQLNKWLMTHITPSVEGQSVYIQDITERKKSEETVLHMAFHDTLTDLPNRLLLQDRLDFVLHHAKRNLEMVAIMFLDLDRFKVINDTLGHQAGDLILKEASRRITNCIREEDTVARFGGDEFVIMLPHITILHDATSIASKILQALAPIYAIGRHEVHLNASIGIATYPADGDTSDILLKNADNALYQAKEAGRNNYKMYTPVMHLNASATLLLENGLRKAIERQELCLYYQPITAVTTKKMQTAEALIRWQHPVKGLIMPSEFIPLAEETGIIVSIGDWVITAVMEQIVKWQKLKVDFPVISINISPRQFSNELFLDFLLHSVEKYGIQPEKIQLEVTESVAMENIGESIPKLKTLKDAGFRIAIDDFGSGYSSLGYLKQLPLDVLKIDKSFTKEVGSKDLDRSIVEAVINLGHTLNLSVCAEGIETQTQYDFFASSGCDTIQGFYISKPLPEKEFNQLFK